MEKKKPKKKIGRPETTIKLDGTRLRDAIYARGYRTLRAFAEEATDLEKEDASRWINRLCLPHGNRNKTGIKSQAMLSRIANLLNVSKEYLTGEDDLIREQMQEKRITEEGMHAKSECDTFLLPIIVKAGFKPSQFGSLDDKPLAMFEKQDNRLCTYGILAEDLRKMENITVDLIRSMLNTMNQNR